MSVTRQGRGGTNYRWELKNTRRPGDRMIPRSKRSMSLADERGALESPAAVLARSDARTQRWQVCRVPITDGTHSKVDRRARSETNRQHSLRRVATPTPTGVG